MPKLLKTPFAIDASEGFRTDIQESTGVSPNSATYQVGFPPVTMQSIASNGMPPKGSDLNGVLYDITDNLVFLTQGGGYGFDAAYATSIGGYPLNARLRLTNGDIVKSTINGNMTDPNVGMTGWVKDNSASQIFDESGKSQQEINDKVLSFSVSSIAELPSSAAANAVAYIQDLDANYIFKSGIWKPYVQVSASLNAFPKLAPELGDEGRFLRAKESLQRQSISSISGLSCYTETVIEVPSGIYNINSEINLSTVAHIRSDGQTIIKQSDPTKDIFVLSNFFLTKIEGIKFFGGRRHISFSNANFDATLVKIYDCEFWESSDYAIYSIGTVAPTYHMSCHAVARDCKFISCKKIVYNSCDKMEFYGGWAYLDYRNFDANSAAFMVARGSLELHGVLGVPYLGDTSASPRWKANVRWVDNYGIFKANGTRFGGEDGGIPIVYNYSGARSDEPLMGGIVSLIGCQANCGILSNRSDASVVRLMTKVPFLLEIKGCNYILNAPYVSVDPAFDLTAYFAAVANPQLRYKVRIDGNMTAFGGITKTIPDQLIPFASGDVIAQPIAAPKLVSKTSLDSNRAQFVFELENTSIAQEFFITVSGSQNVGGSALYRDFSTYLAATFIGYGSSSIIKELAYTPLPKPTVTKITTPTTKVEIESLFWGEGTTGNVEQDAVSANKRFSLIVKNCSGNVNATSVTINLLQTN